VFSIAVMALTVFVAASIGIIDLIGRGYRYTSYFFLLVFFIPLLTRGTWLVARGRILVSATSLTRPSRHA
jgi:uncharacterized membrane protein YkvI